MVSKAKAACSCVSVMLAVKHAIRREMAPALTTGTASWEATFASTMAARACDSSEIVVCRNVRSDDRGCGTGGDDLCLDSFIIEGEGEQCK